MTSPRALAALWVVALVALGLRAWGVDYGLPSIAHDDEWQYVLNAVSMRERASPTVQTRGSAPYINPTGFTLAAVPVTWAVDALTPVDSAGAGGDSATPRARYRADRGRYHLAVRRLSVLLGVLTIFVLYSTARAFSGPRAALLAAALLAVSPLHVRDSHFATNDVALTLLMISAFGVLLRLREGDPHPLRRIALCGALFGAACATKYSAAPLLLPLLALLWRRPALERGKALVAFLAASAAAFLLLFPAVLLEPMDVLLSIREQAAYGAQLWPGQDPGTTPGLHLETLVRALGIPGLGLAVWGLLGMLERRRWVLASYPILHLMLVLPMAMVFARLDLPLLPFLCLGVAYAVRGWTNRSWAPLLVVAVLVMPALWSVRISDLMSRPDTRRDLTQWLGFHLEAGGEVVVACESSTTLRFLPRAPDGALHPRLKAVILSPGSCAGRGGCGRPLVVRGAEASCANATCARRGALLKPFTAEEAVEAMVERRVRFVLLTSNTWTQPWYAELRRFLADGGRLISPRERATERQPQAFLPGAPEFPSNHEERYGPWDNLWARERPGPQLRIYSLR